MKQEILTHLSTLQEDLKTLSKYLYDNPEESFKEYNSSKYIATMLRKYDFEVEEHYLGIPTAFYGKFGDGYPKICYICEYDADPNHGHISGNNLVSTMAVGAALGLSKVIPKTGGSIVVLGCAGEYVNGCKTTMVKQGTFKDIDVVLMAHPNVITTKTLESKAVLPVKIKYSIPKSQEAPLVPCTATHCSILTSNFIDLLETNLPEGFTIENIITNGQCNPYLISSYCEVNYLITTNNMKNCEHIKDMINSFTENISNILGLEQEISIYQLPYEEMISNENLCRVFSHNLKEVGIIDFHDFHKPLPGLSLGSVSHVVPCINPFIKVTENTSIKYPSQSFANETVKDYAIKQTLKAIEALAITGLDLIENRELLSEIKYELTKKTK